MNYLSTDHLIVYTFLLVTLLVGLWAGRGVKDIRDYAIANREFGTGALVITLIATYLGGWDLICFPSDIFSDGLTHIIPRVVCGLICCLLFIAWFVAPKMVNFKDCLTMGDLMYIFYGKSGQLITGLLGLIYNTTVISSQILFLSHVCEWLGVRSDWGLSLATLVLVIYTAKGGMRAVTTTDILQFIAIVVAIPLLAHLMIYQAGGIRALLSRVPSEKLQLLNLGQDTTGAFSANYYAFPILVVWFLFPGFPLSFPFIQRMLMVKNKQQGVNMYYISTAFLITFFLLLALIGLATLVVYPYIDSQNVFNHVVNNLPVGIKGLVWAASLAVIMAAADSFLQAAGVSLTHDLIKPLLERRSIVINELKVVQYTTLLIGCLAIVVALGIRDLYKIFIYGMDLTALLFTIPLIAGVMGLKTESKSFLVSLLATLAAFFLTNLYLNEEIAIPICVLVNVLSFFGTHYLHHRVFVVVKRAEGQEHIWNPNRGSLNKKLKTFLPTPDNLKKYSQEKIDKYGAQPTLFALFIAFSYMVPLFMHSYGVPSIYHWLLGIRGIGALLCVGLMLQPIWPVKLRSYFPVYYHFSLLYCLPFVTTFFFLLEKGSIEWVINVALSIMLLIVLTDWLTFVVLSVLGVTLAMIVYKLGIGPLVVSMDIDTKYTLFYAVAFSTLIGLLFARRKEQKIEKKQRLLINKDAASQTQLLRTAEERFRTLEEIKNIGPQNLLQIAKDLQSLPLKEGGVELLHSIEARLIPLAFQMQSIDTKSQDYLRLQITAVPIQQWITNLKKQLEGYVSQPIDCRITTQHREFCCDPDWITTLIVRSVALLQHQVQDNIYKDQESLLLGIEDTLLSYRLPDVAKDYVKQVKALRILITTEDELPSVETHYWPDLTTSQAASATTTRALTEQEIRRIVKAHYGYVHLEEHMLCCVVPVDLKEVRPRDVDKNHMELGIKPIRANDHYKSGQLDAQAQEKAFLSAVKKHSNADVGLVKKALELIKWYHGPVHRHSGEPFYLHPLAVAQIVLDYNTDQQTILGALLHDTVEDTWMFLQHIKTVFGQDTAQVVGLVTHLQSIPGSIYKVKLSVSENLQMLERSGSKQALYVKLADRVHNMRTINGHSSYAKKEQIAEETLQFFVPLAEKLGLREAAEELKELCKRVS